MNQPTPGPWRADDRGQYIWAEPEQSAFMVAQTRGWGHLTGHGANALGLPFEEAVAIQEANANLIAAAPELLAALEKALRDSGCDGDLCTRQWHEDARAAIAKATGGTP